MNESLPQEGAGAEYKNSPDYTELRSALEAEWQRRVDGLARAMQRANIPPADVVIAPPVLDRTDFGYMGQIDCAYLGSAEGYDRLYEAMVQEGEVAPFVLQFNAQRLEEINKDVPQLHSFLTRRRGKGFEAAAAPKEQDAPGIPEEELEARMRRIMPSSEKEKLAEQRIAIARAFVREAREKAPVRGWALSGSMVNDKERFGLNSDIDLDILLDSPASTRAERNAHDLIEVYLRWKYAEQYGVKIDVSTETIKEVRETLEMRPELKAMYAKKYPDLEW